MITAHDERKGKGAFLSNVIDGDEPNMTSSVRTQAKSCKLNLVPGLGRHSFILP